MTIKINLQNTEKPTQESISLQVSKTLDGNLLINDHKYIDIVVNPQEGKIFIELLTQKLSLTSMTKISKIDLQSLRTRNQQNMGK